MVIEMWMEPLEVPLGDRLRALVRVANRGTESPTWETNRCGLGPAPVTIVGATGMPPGQSWMGLADEFKRRVLSEYGVPERSAQMSGADRALDPPVRASQARGAPPPGRRRTRQAGRRGDIFGGP